MTLINGKYILLTGGSRGIGPVIAGALARRGAHIAVAARSQDCPVNFKKINDPKKPIIFQMLYFKSPDEYNRLNPLVVRRKNIFSG